MTKNTDLAVSEKKTDALLIPPAEVPIMDRLLSAVSGGMPLEVLERFMDLAERQQEQEAKQAFHQAFAAFKADPPSVVKDKIVGYTNKKGEVVGYKHASIGNLVGAIIKGMSEHGLSHNWILSQENNAIKVTCRITHQLGHFIETSLSAGADTSGKKNSIQAIASTVTYLERYTLQAATGIAVLDDDDDGQGHQDPMPQQKNDNPPQKKQQPEDPEETRAEQCEEYIDSFCEKTLDELLAAWKEVVTPKKAIFTNDEWDNIEKTFNATKKYLEEG